MMNALGFNKRMKILPLASLFGLLMMPALFLAACSETASDQADPSPESSQSSEPSRSEATSPVTDRSETTEASQLTLVFLGDSLTAGYGLEEDQAFPFLIDERLQQLGLNVRVVNAGVSGDTTAGGLRRLPWLLRQNPGVVVLALGANDGLRGLPLEDSEQNLRDIIRLSKEAGARVILAGMKVPPNYGPDYGARFEAMFPRLAAEHDLPLIDFLLDGVAGLPELNQADGIHPNVEGQRLTAENVLPSVLDTLEALELTPLREVG